MKPLRNKFEMATHEFEVQYGKPRPTWDHTIQTYQGNHTFIPVVERVIAFLCGVIMVVLVAHILV